MRFRALAARAQVAGSAVTRSLAPGQSAAVCFGPRAVISAAAGRADCLPFCFCVSCWIPYRLDDHSGALASAAPRLGAVRRNCHSTEMAYELLSSVFGKSRRVGARARRAPLHPRRAPYGRYRRDFSEEVFVVGAPSGRKSPWRDFSEGLFVVGGRQLHFSCKTFAIGGRRTIAKGAEPRGHGPVPPPPCLRPWSC